MAIFMSFQPFFKVISTTNKKNRPCISMNKHNAYYLLFPPSLVFCGLCHAEDELLRGEGGEGGIRTLEGVLKPPTGLANQRNRPLCDLSVIIPFYVFRVMASYDIKICFYIFLSLDPNIIFSHPILNT